MVVTEVLQSWLKSDQVLRQEPAATEKEINQVESEIGDHLPTPLRELLLASRAPEGFLGESYIAFFSATDLVGCWREAQRASAGFIPFASDGGGEWYGYDSRSASRPFVRLPSIGNDWNVAMFLGETWDDFLDSLKRGIRFQQKYLVP